MRANVGLILYICTMATIKFLIQSKSDTAGIYVRLKEGRTIDVKAKTNFIIDSEDWSQAKGQPKNLKDESLKSINGELTALKSRLLTHYNNTGNKLEITTQWLKDFINPPAKAEAEVSDNLIQFIDHFNKLKAQKVKPNTAKRNVATRNLVLKFQQYMKSEFFVKDVDNQFIEKFEGFCLESAYSLNYIARAVKYLKTVCYNARLNNIETSPKIDHVKPKFEEIEKIYLAPEDLKKIKTKDFDTESLNNAKDWLIISCETGQRISDFMRFNKEMILNEKGKTYVEFTQVKTGKLMQIPLSQMVLEILKRRDGDFPKAISDQKYNDYIKEVCKLAKINKKVKGSVIESLENKSKRKVAGVYEKHELVSSHIGRRSFATNNYGTIPVHILMYMTGHESERMFLEYIGKVDKHKAQEAAEYF